MSIELLPKLQSRAPGTPPAEGKRSEPSSAPSRLARRVILVMVAGAFVASGISIVQAISGPEGDRTLTQAVTRGDLLVTAIEQGTLESSENTEIKCKVRGQNTVIWVVESGAYVEPGDELVRLDTLFIEEQINERTKYAHWSRSSAERSEADVTRAELAISEYEEGRYVAELMRLEKDLAIAESNLLTAQNMLSHAEMLAESRYVSQLEIEEKTFAVTQAKLDLDVKKTEIDVLERFSKAEQLETLRGNLAATRARHEANAERAFADASRRDRALEEFKHCVVRAERSGLVIHPSAARWENAPEIAEGATVHKDQVLLLMPDLTQMQVKIGVHESIIDRVKPGLSARVTLPNQTLDGIVSSVASVTRPPSWWNGNVVKYDTIIELPGAHGLTPGMSAEVEVILARYDGVLKIPVAAVVEQGEENYCWVKTTEGTQRRPLKLGDSDEVFTIVKSGLKEGDEVILNPLTFEQARRAKGTRLEDSNQRQKGPSEPDESGDKEPLPTPDTGEPANASTG